MRPARSFFSLFIGWVVALPVYLHLYVDLVTLTPHHYGIFFPLVALIVVWIAWLLFVIPLLLKVPAESQWLDFPWMPLTSTALAFAVYAILVGTWFHEALQMAWMAGIIGAIGGTTYALLGKLSVVKRYPILMMFVYYLTPFVSVVLIIRIWFELGGK